MILTNQFSIRIILDFLLIRYLQQNTTLRSVLFQACSSLKLQLRAGVGLDAFFPGDKVTFDNLEVTFLVDEDLENFKEVYDWIGAIVPIH